ncbi:MAG: gamma-glutamylcyclotransferase [Geitlerinemataceae cyanobacterium]
MMSSIDVFVYGTLKPGNRYYRRYCLGKTIEEREAIVYGQLYHLPTLGYPAMTTGVDRVRGFLLSFTDREILTQLDDLEGYDPTQSPHQNEYDRTQIEVFDAENSDLSLGWAWVYRQSIDRVKTLGGILLPDGCWQPTIKDSPQKK